MEMIQYTPPVSWDDKGMDWESPDPGNMNCFAAIREALAERAILAERPLDSALFNIMRFRPWSMTSVNAIRNAVYMLAPYFVNWSSKTTERIFLISPRCGVTGI